MYSALQGDNIVRLITFFFVLFGAFAMHIVVQTILPGRRGKVSATREQLFRNFHVDDVLREMERRLAAEGFQIQRGANVQTIHAERKKKRPGGSIMRNYAFEKTKLMVDAQVSPSANGAVARITVAVNDYVIKDTGESDYLEVILDYLTFREQLRPLPPTSNFQTQFAVSLGIMGLFIPILFFLPGMEGGPKSKFLEGVIGIGIMTLVDAVWGLIQIFGGQGRYKGAGFGYAGLGLGFAVIVLGVVTSIIA